MTFIKQVESKGASPSLTAQLEGLEALYDKADKEQAEKDKKLQAEAEKATEEPNPEKESQLLLEARSPQMSLICTPVAFQIP